MTNSCDMTSHVLSMRRRIKSLERDNAQKRILAEDMKMKMKMVQENVKSDAAVMVCLHAVVV